PSLRAGAEQWSKRPPARRSDRPQTGLDAIAPPGRLQQSQARSGGAPAPIQAGRHPKRHSYRVQRLGCDSPPGRRPMLWCDGGRWFGQAWLMLLRVLRNSIQVRPPPVTGEGGMATIVLAHGAWSAAWAWKKMRPLFRAAGDEFFSPSYTGLGQRAHLAGPDIDLSTHIQDVVSVLEFENLKDVVLLGHSYGGMVATGVADKARERIAKVIYLDAFAPKDGQSLFDLVVPRQ